MFEVKPRDQSFFKEIFFKKYLTDHSENINKSILIFDLKYQFKYIS